ncbi:2-hydroxychromene-2-carboxylate isomerase [Caenimonas soli]|uniref:2-hydroxychromene-2-carboxylate isomerase n=1 Tax=Caenimonas soli TaxID=2735555 RepID=UPI0015549F45|nr:2-hydroxychromene-2-carboxylate isomerase [Caenimonas soli]NPC57422.1 2-hydroxychromene-2-carboxylate isomerase [Caenimonas soli]
MSRTIDYYFAPLSPWTYLGHERFTAITKAAGATVHVRPVDINAVFAVSGGVPLAQRPAQRQAYRLVELERFSKYLGVPMNLRPKFFPVPADLAAKLITAVFLHDGQDAAMRISGAVFAAVWAQDRDISNAAVLAQLASECGLPAERNEQALGPEVQTLFEQNTRKAIETQIFGAPSYVIDGEIFWGQDRLDFVQRALAG